MDFPDFLVFIILWFMMEEFFYLESVVKAAARRDNDKAIQVTNTSSSALAGQLREDESP